MHRQFHAALVLFARLFMTSVTEISASISIQWQWMEFYHIEKLHFQNLLVIYVSRNDHRLFVIPRRHCHCHKGFIETTLYLRNSTYKNR